MSAILSTSHETVNCSPPALSSKPASRRARRKQCGVSGCRNEATTIVHRMVVCDECAEIIARAIARVAGGEL